jgi:putative FmdB family regulatory protein
MPLYSYLCACGYAFDKIQLYSSENEVPCPKCGRKAKRVPTKANWVFSPFLQELSKGNVV